MIRFMPDSWIDVVMRPLDMVAPEANSYVEIAAPDVRLAAALLLAAAVLVLWRRRAGSGRAALWLLALLLVSMVIWLGTSGNGRYFIAWLVLLGPLCMAWVRLLPTTAVRKVFLGLSLVAAQLFVLTQSPPWGSWTWVEWSQAPYFQVDKPPAEPATYVTIANITYSLVAQQFPAQSRWVALGGGIAKRDKPAVNKLFAASPRVTLLAPALPSAMLPDGRPTVAATEALGRLLQPHGLFLTGEAQCRFLGSVGMWRISHRQGTEPTGSDGKYGFWLCPLEYRPVTPAAPEGDDPAVNALFQAVETLCPRFFSGGGDAPMKINGGWLKYYDSDTKVYVLDDGTTYYKFWRSLNPVKIATAQQLRAGQARLDCSKIRAPNWRRGGP